MGTSADPPQSDLNRYTVKAWPNLLTAMLEQELAATGRVYWLMRFIDSEGSGWLNVEHVRFVLTNKESPLKIVGWRRLRQLLHEGEGIFWERDSRDRLWLAGAHKVAHRLKVERLLGKPIKMPLSALVGGMQSVRANFFASYHSGRTKGNPISRRVLQEITSVPARTQRLYDAVTHTGREQNICVGEPFTPERFEEQAFDRGRALFVLRDALGKYGRRGEKYLAWHLPNSYDGPHLTTYRGRQKKINQRLNALVMQGMQANGQDGDVDKLFWPQAKLAGKAWNKHTDLDAYWPDAHTAADRYQLWGVITAEV